MPAAGDLLGDKYRVLEKLGEGGMGCVFRAENILTGKLVAIKWMHPQVAKSGDAAERMLREARAASRLRHPNVVDVYDVVRDKQTLFLVMELLEGETLGAYLDRNLQPKVSEFVALLLPALAGVAAAHAKGVIHRDLKPDNIFLVHGSESGEPIAKVVDFGVAKLIANQGLTLTETGTALGTPLYMSLEQLRGDKDVDARVDVYAFGVMLYEAVTGQMPFLAATLSELAIKVATTDAAPVKHLRPDVPAPLAQLIDWSMARDRARRLPDMRTLISELEVFARDHGFRNQMAHRDAAPPRLASRVALLERRAAAPPHTSQSIALRSPTLPVQPAAADSLTAHDLVTARRTPHGVHAAWFITATLVLLAAAVALFWPRPTEPTLASPSPRALPASNARLVKQLPAAAAEQAFLPAPQTEPTPARQAPKSETQRATVTDPLPTPDAMLTVPSRPHPSTPSSAPTKAAQLPAEQRHARVARAADPSAMVKPAEAAPSTSLAGKPGQPDAEKTAAEILAF